MAQPIVTFYNEDNTAEVTSWDLGELNANSVSPSLKLNIWNNRAGTEDVSDMKEVSVTCLDGDLDYNGEVVVNQWMNVKMLDDSDSFTPVGGTTTKSIKAAGQTDNTIKGTANDGTLENSTDNFVPLEVKLIIPMNSTAGLHNFNFRCQYFYT